MPAASSPSVPEPSHGHAWRSAQPAHAFRSALVRPVSPGEGDASGLFGPKLVTAAGLGLLFVPLFLVALTRYATRTRGLILVNGQWR